MQRNIFLFILCSALILASWFYFVPNQNPSKDKGDDTKKVVLKQDDKDKKPVVKEEKPVVKKPDEKKEDKKLPPIIVEPAKVAKLGGDGFHLSVDVTTLGAGV